MKIICFPFHHELQYRSYNLIKKFPYAHCKFRRVVLTPRGHFRPFGKRVVSTPRKGRFNSKGSFDYMEGSK